ncbi:MAG: signal recognition particle-docking protein FtsY [Candidatus Woesearchaeota archaeon]
MFNFLKDKLKSAIESISKKADRMAEEGKKPEAQLDKKIKTIPEKPIVEKIEKPAGQPAKPVEPAKAKPSEKPADAKPSFFERLKESVTKKKLSEKQFDELFLEMEHVLLENSVALEVVEKIKDDLKTNLVDRPLDRDVGSVVRKSLRESLEEIFNAEKIGLLDNIREKKPYVICFVGVNGSGKTTTIAKIAYLLKQHKLTSVIAASDTFRAAAIQQLEEHAKKLSVRMIKHDYGADASAVAFDAIKHAQAHGIDAVLIDTAGRLHSNVNLMDEMKKLKRVAKPDMIIFVGESITGNDCVEQARKFDEAVGIDAIILTKADVDEKGGAAISISYVTKKPIIYLANGQGYANLGEFDAEKIIAQIGL